MFSNSDTLKGAGFMMAAMAGFVINDAFMRSILEELPLFQSIFVRGIFLTILLTLVTWHQGALRFRPEPKDKKRIFIRSLSELGATFCFLTALTLMPLANLTAILQVLPLTVTLAAAVFMGAHIGWRRIAAIIIGFIGVLIVIRPTADGFTTGAILALVSVAIVTLRDLTARSLNRAVPSVYVALNSSVLMVIVTGIISLFQGWEPISLGQISLFLAASLVLAVGYIAAVASMRIGDIAMVTPFRYTALLWAIVLGALFFDETPDRFTILGSAIIVAMGIYTFYRESRTKS